MRSPSAVAEQIAAVVPEEFKARFMRLVNDFSYKAPEQTHGCWVRLSRLCNEMLGGLTLTDESEDWEVKMIAILTDTNK